MQRIVFDEPYQFVPPYRGTFWSWAVGKLLPRTLRNRYGIQSWESHGLEHLRKSLDAGYGIILCPNHSRVSDPMLSGVINTETPTHLYAMASWHVFKQNRFETFIARRIGGFSIYREGIDRLALDAAVSIVSTAERPLIIFPEGVISAANDRLMPLMEGTSFVARAAARKRAKTHPDSKVVIHPVGYHYQHQSDPEVTLTPVVAELEKRIFWRTQEGQPLPRRIQNLRDAILSVREVQMTGQARTGNIENRIAELVNHILQTYEAEWLDVRRTGDTVSRVKDLRIEIVKEMVNGDISDDERQRRWRHLTDIYYAQCLSLHVPGYVDEQKAGSRFHHRLFETVARLEEELTDSCTEIGDMHVDIRVGEAIEVDPKARRSRDADPLMVTLRERMLALLGIKDEWPLEPVVTVS